METFDSTKRGLYELLKDVSIGKIQLPDFQRGWVWNNNRMIGILASIAKSFPIGAIMLLETGNNNVRFKTKYVEGVNPGEDIEPEYLVLDGQQRITSLYQAIISKQIVHTRNEKGYAIKRWYYIDMQKAMDDDFDLEDAILSINENKQITRDIGREIVLDLSKPEYEYRNLMYPVSMIDEYSHWRREFNKYWNHDSEMSEFWDKFEDKVINNFNKYMVPIIKMFKDNPKEAVCQVFEKVNTGGVPLTVFELLTATFAVDEFDLKEDWKAIRQGIVDYKPLDDVSNTDFIQAVTLLSTYTKRIEKERENPNSSNLPAVSCKRKDMLNLTLEDYKKHRNSIVKGFIKASKILVENHIYKARDLPYSTQLIPLAAILSVLGNKIDNIANKNKLMQWYWCGVLGELYGAANETRYALDLPQVINWILYDDNEPKTVYEASFSPSRLHTLRTRNSAAYKGIYALLMHDNTKDWLTATKIDFSTYFSESIDIHHIFPVKWCNVNNIDRTYYDSIINKTPLSGRTNRIVSGDAPSKYLERIKKHAGVNDEEFNTILRSHVLEPTMLYADDFYSFFEDRKEKILQRIEQAMNKEIYRDVSYTDEEGYYVNEEESEENVVSN